MSPELRENIEHHRESLRRILGAHADLLHRLRTEQPTLIEREALGAVMHSFYMGIESIMRSVAKARGDQPRKSDAWHQELLGGLTKPGPGRAVLLSESTAARLYEYLTWRHRFRNLYTDALDWTLMRPLVMGMNPTLAAFEVELDRFLSSQQ